jgi:hypothetical protein
MNTVDLGNRYNLIGIVTAATSLFGFLGNIMTDYNWGTNFLTNSFALIYAQTLERLTPFAPGASGIAAFGYFGLFLSSFALLNRSKPARVNLLETARLGALVVILFEVALYYFVPYFMDKWVMQVLYGTPLQDFTNLDLAVAGIVLFAVPQAYLRRIHKSPR